MSTTQAYTETAPGPLRARRVDLKLEVVVLPVSDVERTKRFYISMGWRLDADFATGDSWRVVQVTPPRLGVLVLFRQGTHEGNAGLRSGTAPHGR